MQITKKNTAWYNDGVLPQEMVKGALGNFGWGRLEDTTQFKALDELVQITKPNSIVDVGCGSAETGRIYSDIDYLGLDLPHIIKNVAKVVNPNLKYKEFDVNTSDFTILKDFDLIICNGVLSELYNPLEILNKLLTNMGKYLIIHRQGLGYTTTFSAYKTYGDLKTVTCRIGRADFSRLLTNHTVIKEKILSANYGSLLIKVIKESQQPKLEGLRAFLNEDELDEEQRLHQRRVAATSLNYQIRVSEAIKKVTHIRNLDKIKKKINQGNK